MGPSPLMPLPLLNNRIHLCKKRNGSSIRSLRSKTLFTNFPRSRLWISFSTRSATEKIKKEKSETEKGKKEVKRKKRKKERNQKRKKERKKEIRNGKKKERKQKRKKERKKERNQKR